MPDIILDDFKKDLTKLKRLLNFLEIVRAFKGVPPSAGSGDNFYEAAKGIHTSSLDCHPDLLVLSGAIVLYLGGRFEFFIRERFEAACDDIAGKCKKFGELPKQMQDNLIKLTAEVMLSPRKYGHAERGVESFVRNLGTNMAAENGLTDINRKCLSITFENMRPDTLRDLFKRIGLEDIWKTVGEQSVVKAHFGEVKSSMASTKTTEYLNSIMETRNSIAHPSANVEWPDISKVSAFIKFFEVIAPVISDLVFLHVSVQKDHKAVPTIDPTAPIVETATAVLPEQPGSILKGLLEQPPTDLPVPDLAS